jgi:hypothetical protein
MDSQNITISASDTSNAHLQKLYHREPSRHRGGFASILWI